ncbi:MAG: SH3 domain-containing protein [Balneolaceae bacterium]
MKFIAWPTIVFITLQLLTASSLFAQQSEFDRANELFEEQQIEEALSLYRSIEEDQQLSGKLFYNMGLSAIHLDSLGLAKYYFMRATQYPEMRHEALDAVNYVNNRFNRRSAVLPKLPWERFFEWLGAVFGPVWMMAMGLVLINLGIAGILTSWFTHPTSSLFRKAGNSLACLGLLLMCTSIYLQYLENRYDTGVMIRNDTVVHEQPDAGSSAISTAYEGYTLTVDNNRSEPEENWAYIRLENGMYGWIERKAIKTF